MMTILIFSLVILFLLILLGGMLFSVEQQKIVAIERFGKFLRIAGAGLHAKIPLIDDVAHGLSLKVQQLNTEITTKTSDNVFVKVEVSVQYQVILEKAQDAFYKLTDHTKQISSYVFDVVRANVPKMKLDEVFLRKDDIAIAVKAELQEAMTSFGYSILTALVIDIAPDSKVVEAMNEINAAQRLREAATEKGEAEKILMVKQAEAESESKKLQGEGIANQRKAILTGLKTSMEDFKEGLPDATSRDVMNLVMMTQYFDTIRDLKGVGTHTILLPYSPNTVGDLSKQMMEGLIVGNEVNKNKK